MIGGRNMQKETTITIADDNVDFAQILNKFLSNQEGIRVWLGWLTPVRRQSI